MEPLLEYVNLYEKIKDFPRSSLQKNNFNESDAEILELEPGKFLALSLDIFGDELSWGIFKNNINIGNHAIQSAFSDIAAVGYTPHGVMQCLMIGKDQSQAMISEILLGLKQGLDSHQCFLIGGDTGSAINFNLQLLVFGLSDKKPISRIGLKEGDIVFSTHLGGKGNSLVAYSLLNRRDAIFDEKEFLAQARVNESQIISRYASAMIDSSDGFLNSLDLLARLNKKGIQLHTQLSELTHPLAKECISKLSLNPWALLAGEFGDYELIFSIPEQEVEKFKNEYLKSFSNLIEIGRVVSTEGVYFKNPLNKIVHYEAAVARNLFINHSNNVTLYLKEFLELGKSLGF